jgi:hypothetical protein
MNDTTKAAATAGTASLTMEQLRRTIEKVDAMERSENLEVLRKLLKDKGVEMDETFDWVLVPDDDTIKLPDMPWLRKSKYVDNIYHIDGKKLGFKPHYSPVLTARLMELLTRLPATQTDLCQNRSS